MIDGNLTIVITLQKVLRALLEGGYYKPFPGITAGIIRMRVLFEGGSYMRKYGSQTSTNLRQPLTMSHRLTFD